MLKVALKKRTGLLMIPITRVSTPTEIKQESSNTIQRQSSSPTSVANLNNMPPTMTTSSQARKITNYSSQQHTPTTSTASKTLPTDMRSSYRPNYPSYEHFLDNIRQTTLMTELAIYHHQSMGSPPETTFSEQLERSNIICRDGLRSTNTVISCL